MMIASGVLTVLSLGLPRGYLLRLTTRHAASILYRAVNLRSPSPGLLLAILLTLSAGAMGVRELALLVRAPG